MLLLWKSLFPRVISGKIKLKITISFNERQEIANNLNFLMCLPENSVAFETVVLPKQLFSSYIWNPDTQVSSQGSNSAFPKSPESNVTSEVSVPNWALFKLTSDDFFYQKPITDQSTQLFHPRISKKRYLISNRNHIFKVLKPRCLGRFSQNPIPSTRTQEISELPAFDHFNFRLFFQENRKI